MFTDTKEGSSEKSSAPTKTLFSPEIEDGSIDKNNADAMSSTPATPEITIQAMDHSTTPVRQATLETP